MLKSDANPEGLPIEVFDNIRKGVFNDRSQFYKDLAVSFYGANKEGAKVSQGILEQFWLWSMQSGMLNAYESVKAFSETDFTDELKKMTVPTLVLHGEAIRLSPSRTRATRQRNSYRARRRSTIRVLRMALLRRIRIGSTLTSSRFSAASCQCVSSAFPLRDGREGLCLSGEFKIQCQAAIRKAKRCHAAN